MSPPELERGALDPELSHRPSHLLLKLSSKIWLSNFLEGAWLLGNLTYPDEWDWRQGNATVFVMRGQDYECLELINLYYPDAWSILELGDYFVIFPRSVRTCTRENDEIWKKQFAWSEFER